MTALLLLVACSGPEPVRGSRDTATTTPVEVSAPSTGQETTPPGTTLPTETTATDTGLPDDAPETVPDLGEMFSHPSGVYDAPLVVTLSPAVPGADVVCTTDGSTPDPDGPACVDVEVDRTMVIRASTVESGRVVLGPRTRTYVLTETARGQEPPPSWPEEWWGYHETGPYTADYGMDLEVWDAPDADVVGALEALPIVSLVLDVDDLFGPEGIHENPESRGADWERPAHLELLSSDGSESLSVACGARIHGGSGRRPDRSPKKSFRVLFKGEYGPKMLEYPLYAEEPDRFDTLVLRAGYNRVWNNWQGSQRTRSQYMRERYAGDVLREMGHLVPRSRYAHLYLDGLYWGVYLIQERPDASMQAEHLGGDAEDYDALNSGEAVDGDLVAWERLLALAAEDLTDPVAYEAVLALLERDRFIEYMLVNFALGNLDWPEKNWWAGRDRSVDGPFTFFSWDTELTLADVGDDIIDWAPPDSPGFIFQQLRANPDFVRRFGDLAHRHLYAPWALLAPAEQQARWAALADEIRPALEAESARWGDHWRDDRADPEGDLYTVGVHWEDEYERLMERYFEPRHDAFLEDLRAAGLYPLLDAPVPDVLPGEVPVGTLVTFEAAEAVWLTTDGRDPRADDDSVADGATGEPVVIDGELHIMARARAADGTWSALVEETWSAE